MPAEIKGLAQKHEHPLARVGPKDFEWPDDPDTETRAKFAAALRELLDAKGWKPSELAATCFGRQAFKDGDFRPARNQNLISSGLKAKAFPSARNAGYIAQALNVTMARLLEPERPRKKGNGNGHGLANEPHEPSPPPLPLPEGATPAIVEMSTNKSDARFVDVNVKGTLPVDVAMSLFALIHPRS